MDMLSIATSLNMPIISAFLLLPLAAISLCTVATDTTAMAYVSRGLAYHRTRHTRISTLPLVAGEKAMGPFLIGVGIYYVVLGFSPKTF
jgi:hypothetical protein